MSKGLETLKEIGIQKVHEKTHISRKHIEALFCEDFEDLNKVQFLGFLSILEREYELKLDELREKGLEYFGNTSNEKNLNSKIFITTKKKKSYTKLYLFIIFVILVVAAFYTTYMPMKSIDIYKTDNNFSNTTFVVKELNTTKKKVEKTDINITKQPQKTEDKEIKVVKSLKIIPQKKLWVGYMNLDTHEKKQKLIKNELVLDPNGRWLLSLGHANVNIDINGKIKAFHSKKNIKFIYENSKLKEIDFEEFKRLNKGDKW